MYKYSILNVLILIRGGSRGHLRGGRLLKNIQFCDIRAIFFVKAYIPFSSKIQFKGGGAITTSLILINVEFLFL